MRGRIMLIIAGAVLLALLVSCGQKEEQAQMEEPTQEVQVVSAKAVDPVCGMEVDPKTAMTAEHLGQTHHFCSAQCRDQFLQDPAKYIKSQGMVDPVCGMKIDPQTAVKGEFEGKAYYFCSAECHEKFMQDPGKYMSPEEHHMEGKSYEGHGH
jgi:YHS domain-containing protein